MIILKIYAYLTNVDPAQELWESFNSDDKAMEDYLWGRDYIDVPMISGILDLADKNLLIN